MTQDTIQAEIIQEFAFFEDWTDKYKYLIDLGKNLPDFPETLKIDAHKVQGCQSQVWIVPREEGGKLHFLATSDGAIVCGLIALLLRIYSGRTPQEIMNTSPNFIQAIGLHQHLSPTRSNGLTSMIHTIQVFAKKLAEKKCGFIAMWISS